MAELATLARPYANAVFAIAKADGELDRWSRMLEFLTLASADARIKVLLEAPETAEEQKAFQLINVCGDELNERARKFVHVLAANKRLALVAEISEQFEQLRALEQQSLDVEVVSAFPLSDAEAERLRAALGSRFAKEVQLTSRVDKSLIGGAVIRAGDMVIDGSVRGKLDKLSETIQRT
jgi:F-type H+-transporting ATPase subunit delta